MDSNPNRPRCIKCGSINVERFIQEGLGNTYMCNEPNCEAVYTAFGNVRER